MTAPRPQPLPVSLCELGGRCGKTSSPWILTRCPPPGPSSGPWPAGPARIAARTLLALSGDRTPQGLPSTPPPSASRLDLPHQLLWLCTLGHLPVPGLAPPCGDPTHLAPQRPHREDRVTAPPSPGQGRAAPEPTPAVGPPAPLCRSAGFLRVGVGAVGREDRAMGLTFAQTSSRVRLQGVLGVGGCGD